MSKYQYECESVDLTEDEDDGEEDSRDTVVESQKSSRNVLIRNNIPNLNSSPLPPLIPIPRISAPKTSNGARSVPTLTKIQSLGEAPKVADNRNFARDVTLVGSPHSPVTSIPTTQIPSTPGGKVILIKKNNKLYKIVIPHNVMPSSDAGGPVIINIPEVGPLVIKIDPQAKNQPAAKPTPIIEPFSLNFDDIIEKASMGEAVEDRLVAKSACTSTEKMFSVTKMFPCWTTPAARTTRTKNTFNGFSKREMANSKRCHNQLNNVIVRYKKKIEAERKVIQYKASRIKMNTKSLKRNTDSYRDFDSLLMTKKVVVLNGDEETNEEHSSRNSTSRTPVWRRKIPSASYEKINLQPFVCLPRWDGLESRYKHLIKPCFVSMKRMDKLDEMIKNDGNVALRPIKNYQSLLRLSLMAAKAPNSVSNLSPATLEERRDLYLSRLIKDVRTFNTLMAFIKPVLVMNEYNYSIVNIKTEFCKANLVYPVGQDRRFPDKILACADFRFAVANDYIKLVDSELLCRYFKGEVGPRATMS